MVFTRRAIAVVLATFFISGVFLCAGVATDTHHGMAESHQICPLMGGTGACQSVMDHLSHWQSIFTVVPSDMFSTMLALLTLLACACVWILCRDIRKPLPLAVARSAVMRERSLLPRSYLQEAFSNGILHSKAF